MSIIQKIFRWLKVKVKTLNELLKEAFYDAFFSPPFRIRGIIIDSLTGKALFQIKIRKMVAPVEASTQEIIDKDLYFFGLSASDRNKVVIQYKKELREPLACIFEHPISSNAESLVFKILILEKKCIVSGTAEYFLKKRKDILEILSNTDIITLSMAYSEEISSSVTFQSFSANIMHLREEK